MPWTKDNPPSVAKNWTDSEKEKCVAAANAVLEDGGSDEDAVFACISAAGKSKEEKSMDITLQKLGILHREIQINREMMDQEKRTIEVSFSSEEPADQWWGREILDHNPKSVRMKRLRTGAPFQVGGHYGGDEIGVIEKAWIEDKKGRAIIKLSRGQKAKEYMDDIVEGIRTNISVGYRIHKMVLESEEEKNQTYRVTDWEPY